MWKESRLYALESPEYCCNFKAQHSENKDHGIGPITSWEIDGETVETMSDLIFWGSKITADGDCSHEIKTLIPWKKSYDQLR